MGALLQAALALNDALATLSFARPVTHVYNPMTYAAANYAEYVRRYGTGPKVAVFLGMNPGPFGMAQTGIPFGDVVTVGEWLRIGNPVSQPPLQHPKRIVEGLNCSRVEVSGQRLWGAIRDRFGTPETFFRRFFVANYCPLCFIEESGRNRTPDKLPLSERKPLLDACDEHLRAVVRILEPQIVVGIGGFAETRARAALDGMDVQVAKILHPSPANPSANRDWAGTVRHQLCDILPECGA